MACARDDQVVDSRKLMGIRGRKMKRTYRTFVSLMLGGSLGLALGFAASLGIAPAVVRDVPPVVSYKAAKQDRLDTASPTRRTSPQVVAATQTETAQPAGSLITLLDREGHVVYRHDPAAKETMVAWDTVIPIGLNDRLALQDRNPAANLGEAVRMATMDPEGFMIAALSERR